MHRLAFCEPSTQKPNDPSEIFVESGNFNVNQRMYNLILIGPKIIYQDNEEVGYVFGHLYGKEQYEIIGSHGNDVAQTGIFDLDLYNPQKDYEKIIKRYYGLDDDWNDRTILGKIRREIPELLWLGYTFGGDVGAAYYGHYNIQDEMDSLVVSIDWINK